MTTSPFISFCVPVYNRENYIEETLSSLLRQESIFPFEVVVSDNCSSDNTCLVVEKMMSVYSNLKLVKNNSNLGADQNYLKVVASATGKYCWLFGSDDILTDNAIACIEQELIRYSPQLCLVDQFIGDVNAKPLKRHKLLSGITSPSVYDLSNEAILVNYINCASSQSSIFGFLSVIIFCRSTWLNTLTDESYIGTLYVHAQKLFRIAREFPNRLLYVPKAFVIWRGANDSFGGPGKYFYRYNIDFDGFRMLHDDFIPPTASFPFRRLFRRHHPLINICYLRLNCSRQEFLSISHKLLWYGYPSLAIYFLSLDLIGKHFLQIAFIIYSLNLKIVSFAKLSKSRLFFV